MLDILTSALATPGLIWMALTIAAAGLVRGFTGFGTAMIFVPIAGHFLPPADVVLVITTTGVFSTAALFPPAWRQADKAEVSALAIAAAITVPLGLWLLTLLAADTVRWITCIVIGATLLTIIAGWRWEGRLGWGGRFGIGGAAGTIGGMTGLTGPVVIIFYLANARDVTRVRANTIVFLGLLDVVIVANLLIGGLTSTPVLMLALILSVPYFITTMIGKAWFDPKHERLYRVASYSVIALAVVTGLPILD